MTKLLEQALAVTSKLPPEMQDELARLILAFAGADREIYELSEEELADIDEADRSGMATDAEVAALWAKAER
jgi:hypothetical protein